MMTNYNIGNNDSYNGESVNKSFEKNDGSDGCCGDDDVHGGGGDNNKGDGSRSVNND